MKAPAWCLVLAACSGPTADRDAYLQAVRETDIDAAASACHRVGDRPLRGDCLAHVAREAARGRDRHAADAVCDGIGDPLWSAECFFLVADELELTGDLAVAACHRAGSFRSNCLGHAIGREVRSVEKRLGKVGQEKLLEAEIDEVVRRYKPGAPADQRAVTTQTMTARILAARWGEGPMDASLCGRADPELCARAYRGALDATPHEVGIDAICDGPLDAEEVAKIGARGWTPDSEAIARLGWQRFCEDLRNGRLMRDGSTTMGLLPRTAPPLGELPGDGPRGPPIP